MSNTHEIDVSNNITNPSTTIELNVDYWPSRSLAHQLSSAGDSNKGA